MPVLDGFCSCPAGYGGFSGVGSWVFSGKIPGVHSGSVLVGSPGHYQRFMRAFGGRFGHFRRLMRAFGGCVGVS